MAIQEQDGELNSETAAHNYNLRKRPTKCTERISLMVTDEVTGVEPKRQYTTIHPKVHAHVMLSQKNVKEGLLTFCKKGNEAILRELKQLHDKKVLMSVSKTNMSCEE